MTASKESFKDYLELIGLGRDWLDGSAQKAWNHQQTKIDKLELNRSRAKCYECGNEGMDMVGVKMQDKIDKLQEENELLRECVERISNRTILENSLYSRWDATTTLKQLDEGE